MGNFAGFGNLRGLFGGNNNAEGGYDDGLERVQQGGDSSFAEEYWRKLTLKAVPDDENRKNADVTGVMGKYDIYHNDEKHFSIICDPEMLEQYQKAGIAPETRERYCIFPEDWREKGKYPHIQSDKESLLHKSANREKLSDAEEEELSRYQEELAKARRKKKIIEKLDEGGHLDEIERRFLGSGAIDLPLLQVDDNSTTPATPATPAADPSVSSGLTIEQINALVNNAVQQALDQRQSDKSKTPEQPTRQQNQPSPDDFDDQNQNQPATDDFPFTLDANGCIPGLDKKATAGILQQYEAAKKQSAGEGGNA